MLTRSRNSFNQDYQDIPAFLQAYDHQVKTQHNKNCHDHFTLFKQQLTTDVICMILHLLDFVFVILKQFRYKKQPS